MASLQAAHFASFEGLRAQKSVEGAVATRGFARGDDISRVTHTSTLSIVSKAVAAPVEAPSRKTEKRSRVEIIKEKSNFLRWPLLDDLTDDKPNVSADSEQLIKFHGSYQQDDRERRAPGSGKAYQFMMRTKQPGGKVASQLYLTMDDLANKYGNGTLRLTTRQTFQLHGVLKENLKTVFSTVIRNMGSTLGACGDLNRNVLAPAPPFADRPEYVAAQRLADELAMLLAPQAGAYYDVWLDGEKAMSSEREPAAVAEARADNRFGTNFEGSPEPIYGTQYLPRKFKIAVTVPGDNSVDLLTNDVGIVVMSDGAGGVRGYNIYVGGGMGRTHRNEDTFPALAQPLGYVPKEDILYAVKAIVATQRDHGRRDDRKQARMKYLIHDWGIDKFRSTVEGYYGKPFEPFRELPSWKFEPHLGWGSQGDGKLFFGLHVDSGRLKGELKAALREVIETYALPVRISANQNLVLCDVRHAWRSNIMRILHRGGLLDLKYVDPLNVTAMACPALPLCGLAITEAERGMPDMLKRIRGLLTKVKLTRKSDTMVVRMTGCPNGCARPYMAELGLVGDGPNSYQVWLGGTPSQTRLAEVCFEKVKLGELDAHLEPLFLAWKREREAAGESFGDFCHRVGFDHLRSWVANFGKVLEQEGSPKGGDGVSGLSNRVQPRIAVRDDVMKDLRAYAKRQNKSLKDVATEAVASYLNPSVERTSK